MGLSPVCRLLAKSPLRTLSRWYFRSFSLPYLVVFFFRNHPEGSLVSPLFSASSRCKDRHKSRPSQIFGEKSFEEEIMRRKKRCYSEKKDRAVEWTRSVLQNRISKTLLTLLISLKFVKRRVRLLRPTRLFWCPPAMPGPGARRSSCGCAVPPCARIPDG